MNFNKKKKHEKLINGKLNKLNETSAISIDIENPRTKIFSIFRIEDRSYFLGNKINLFSIVSNNNQYNIVLNLKKRKFKIVKSKLTKNWSLINGYDMEKMNDDIQTIKRELSEIKNDKNDKNEF